MLSIDSVNKTNAVRSVPGGVLGAEDGGGVSAADEAPALYGFCVIGRGLRGRGEAGSKISGMSDGAKYNQE